MQFTNLSTNFRRLVFPLWRRTEQLTSYQPRDLSSILLKWTQPALWVRFLLHRGRLRILQTPNTLELGLSLLQLSVQQSQFLLCWYDFIRNIFCSNVYTLMTARAPPPLDILRFWQMLRCYHPRPGKEKYPLSPVSSTDMYFFIKAMCFCKFGCWHISYAFHCQSGSWVNKLRVRD